MRAYVIASVFIILGLVAIAYQSTLSPADRLMSYINNLSSALLVSGMLSLLFRLVLDREYDTRLRRLMRVHDSVDELGLQQIVSRHQAHDFSQMIESSEHLAIVINDGQRWVGNNIVALQSRFGRPGLTELFTVDPDSTFVECLGSKTGHPKEEIQRRIRDTWGMMESGYKKSGRKGTLRIYRLKTYPTRSLFLTEDLLVETPYQIASGRSEIPAFVYRRVARPDSLFRLAEHDLEELRKEARIEKECGPAAP